MPQNFEIVPIPEVPSVAHAGQLIEQFAHTTLPALVIRNVGATGVGEAVSLIEPGLPDGMSAKPAARKNAIKLGNGNKVGDLGFHFDFVLPNEGETELPYTCHFTRTGLAIASLFKAGPGFGRSFVDDFTTSSAQWVSLERQYTAGLANPELVEPICYRAQLTPDTLLIFKSGQALWHIMETQGPDRRSEVLDFMMKITAGMQVRFNEPEAG